MFFLVTSFDKEDQDLLLLFLLILLLGKAMEIEVIVQLDNTAIKLKARQPGHEELVGELTTARWWHPSAPSLICSQMLQDFEVIVSVHCCWW